MKAISRITWGIALVVAGVILILNMTGVTDINLFFKGWWTLFLIIPSVAGLFDREGRAESAVTLVLGVALLLASQGVIEFSMVWKVILAAVLIVVGITCISKSVWSKKVSKEMKKARKKGDKREYVVAFSGSKVKFDKEEFEGCEATAVFGGLEMDLRKAVIKDDVVIDVAAFCAGISIFVPDDVVVKTTSRSIFGGVANKTRLDEKKAGKTIYINANAVFGGVEVK